ncbi:MAG: MFS transporter [Alkalilacustris sp.]
MTAPLPRPDHRPEPGPEPRPKGLNGDLSASRAPLAGLVAMGAIWGTLAAVMPDLRARTGASDAELAAVFFVSALVAVGAMLAAPRIGEWLGAHRLAIACAAMVAAAALPGLAGGVVGLGLSLALLAATSGLADVLLNGRVAAAEAGRGRPLMNLNHAGYSLSFFVGAVLTGLARDAGAGAGVVMAGAALLLAPLVALTWERPVAAQAAPARRTPGAAPGMLWAVLWLGGGVMLLASLLEAGTETWSALHLERTLGAGPALGALGPAVLGLCMGLGRLAGQALSLRLGPSLLMRLGAALAALGAGAATLAPGPVVALAGIAALGLGTSVLVPTALSLVGAAATAEGRTALIARTYALGFAGYVAGPALMGVIAQVAGLRWSFALLALGALATLALVPALMRAARR